MLKRLSLALMMATALTVANVSAARADPVTIGAISAFAATPLGGVLINLGISFAAAEAKTLIQQWFGLGSTTSQPAGVKLTLGTSGTQPCSFILGKYGTAGSLNYVGSWGNDGGTPNAFLTLEIILSDVPMRRLTGGVVGDKRITIPDMSGARPTAQGWPVPEFNDGKDNLWIAYRDGAQTTADAFLRSKFGGLADQPYTDDMIGRGRAVVTVTMRVNQTLFPNGQKPSMIWETDGIDQYNVAKDSTRGGSGTHRADDPATWEPSTNLAVCMHSILMGVYFGDQWVFGLQNADVADQLPASAWIAAINEADLAIDLAAGGTEPQFAGGLEVVVNRQAADVLADYLKGCAGRLAEIGGIYKPLLGAAPAPVYTFTDANVIITRDRTIDPFPTLEQTYNGAQGTYPDPAGAWKLKDAAPIYTPALETKDGGRRMAPGIQFDVVSSGTQVQRLLGGSVKDGRNFRRPGLTLPPEASDLEPLDVVAWNSASEGYSSKAFLIISADDEPNYLLPVQLLETDPSAFDWDAGTDEQPTSVGFITGKRPPVQIITAPSVVGVVIADSDGLPRRVGAQFGWDGEVDDVRSVGCQVRNAGGDIILSESTDNVAAGSVIFSSNALLPNQAFQGRSIYYARSPRPTDWTDWLDFTTPNVGLDTVDLSQRYLALVNLFRDVSASFADALTRISQVVQDQDAGHQVVTEDIRAQLGDAVASFTQQIAVLVDGLSAQAILVQSLNAALGGNSASVNVVWEVDAAPAGYSARYVLRAEVNDGSLRQASMFLDVPADPSQDTRIGFSADQAVFFASDGTPINYINGNGEQISANGAVYINWKTGTVRVTKV